LTAILSILLEIDNSVVKIVLPALLLFDPPNPDLNP